jgi:hypothetical protein
LEQVESLPEDVPLETHVYCLCFFERQIVVPEVVLIDAATDDQAVAEARLRRSLTTREVWDRHRLVAVIPASR